MDSFYLSVLQWHWNKKVKWEWYICIYNWRHFFQYILPFLYTVKWSSLLLGRIERVYFYRCVNLRSNWMPSCFKTVKTQQRIPLSRLLYRGKKNVKQFMKYHLVLIHQLRTAFDAREVGGRGDECWLTPCRHDMHRLRYFETAMQSDCV